MLLLTLFLDISCTVTTRLESQDDRVDKLYQEFLEIQHAVIDQANLIAMLRCTPIRTKTFVEGRAQLGVELWIENIKNTYKEWQVLKTAFDRESNGARTDCLESLAQNV